MTGIKTVAGRSPSMRLMNDIARPAAFDEFFNDYFGKVLFVPPFADADEVQLTLKIEVEETDETFTVLAEIPGIRAVVKAEKGISADFSDGVLRITLPKKAAS